MKGPEHCLISLRLVQFSIIDEFFVSFLVTVDPRSHERLQSLQFFFFFLGQYNFLLTFFSQHLDSHVDLIVWLGSAHSR